MSNLIHFVKYYVTNVQMRNDPDRTDLTTRNWSTDKHVTEDLHNLRLRYDTWGYRAELRRIDTKRRYYKRVRADAPFASEIPRMINIRVDLLSKIGESAKVIRIRDLLRNREVVKIKRASRELAE